MSDSLLTLSPEKIVAALRDGRSLTADEASGLDRLPIIDALRTSITQSDIPWLILLFNSNNDQIAGLASSIMRYHIVDSKVRESMETRWESASPYLRNRIMWRLLDSAELNSDWNIRFIEFIFTNRDTFDSFNRHFFGTGRQGLQELRKRMDNALTPAHKESIYWLCIPSIEPDIDQAKVLLTKGLQSKNEFTHHAIQRQLKALS